MNNLTESLNEAERLIAARKYPEALLVLNTLLADQDLDHRIIELMVMPALEELERYATPVGKPWSWFGVKRTKPQIRL